MISEIKRIGSPIPAPVNEGNGTAITVSEPKTMNVCTEMFHEIPVRIVRTVSGAMFPIVDIAKGIDYSRGAIGDLVRRHKEDLDEYSSLLVIRTQAGSRDAICLNRDGVIALFMLLDVKRIKDPAKQQRIREFRRWAIETLGKVMDGIPVQPPRLPVNSLPEIMDHYLITAGLFSQATGIPKNEVVEVALRVVEAKTGEDLELFRQMLAKPEPIIIQSIVPDSPKWDPIRDFLNECCERGDFILKSQLYAAYIQWCGGVYSKPLGHKGFTTMMRKDGFIGGYDSTGHRTWIGLELKTKVLK